MQGDPASLGWASGSTVIGDSHCGGECEKLSQYTRDRAEPEINTPSASSNPQREKVVWAQRSWRLGCYK